MEEKNVKQTQKAGKNSKQIQVGGDLYIGITEQRAREIYVELIQQSLEPLHEIAKEIAKKRIKKFEERLLPKMQAIDGMLEVFAEPSFQLLLTESQKSAACIDIDKEDTYDLLSELLIHRVQKGDNKNVYTAVNRAVDVIDEISDDALFALTIIYTHFNVTPISLDFNVSLNALDGMFDNIFYQQLPANDNWIDNLDMIGAIRVNNIQSFYKFKDYMSKVYSGYIDVGIIKGSPQHEQALKLLNDNNINTDILEEHIFNSNYLQIAVKSKQDIDLITFKETQQDSNGLIIEVEGPECNAIIHQIYDLYAQDDQIKNENIEKFMLEVNKRDNLKAFGEWFDKINTYFTITPIGKVLANANARRCDNRIPEHE